ncbi:DUF4389 domain-containing protein [Pseudarthrobacter sp. fls2-241-R2A-168]|uniref:DUF4389 domain-containing protein n=1 Tax=Pseudarthrobacter sp. fls2-241-R2A-168 TaxID=3040304 RepID=UPI00255565A1|nr:DUF4389 domain-containing protein [Pseudarthrobacter sp. fls2-241-R2A-168]
MKKTVAVIMLILGILLSLAGLAAAAGGIVALAVGSAQRDGYLTAGTARLSVASAALTSPRLGAMGEDIPGRVPFDVGTLRLRVASADPGKAVFIGIAPQSDVDRYLSGVHRSELLDVDRSPFRAEYRDIPGSTAPAPPAGEAFWQASASGPGEQELTWNITAGSWAIVVMNADASPGIDVQVQPGFRSDLIRPAATGLLVGGIIALVIGIPLLTFGAAGLGRHAAPRSSGSAYGAGPAGGPVPPGGRESPAIPGGPAAGAAPAGWAPPAGSPPSGSQPPVVQSPYREVPAAEADWAPYPARLSGEIDPALSRWMWLVKWFLAIPHFIILFFLWFAFAVTTVVAGFAILFTGRYPRALFDFNVGVLRWNWRVAFYSYAAVGTDLYPPFTLARTNYPADFEVDYPERLSRGLVLIKWWLLAIPHLIVVALLAGATWTWGSGTGDFGTSYERGRGLSLLGLLVFIAAVALLFTGRYLRPLFDLILGINRWIYRVLAYTALMRDEYPPFRLDQGPRETAAPATGPPFQPGRPQ